MSRNRAHGSSIRTAVLGAAVALALACVSPPLAQTAPDGGSPSQAPPPPAGAAGAAQLAQKLSKSPDGGPSWGFRAALTLIFPAG